MARIEARKVLLKDLSGHYIVPWTGAVESVNGSVPDKNGNVTIDVDNGVSDRLDKLENPSAEAKTGAAGSSASVIVAKQADESLKFSFTIPRGDKGDRGLQGDRGPTGPAGTTLWSGITDKPSYFISKGISMGRLP